MASLIELEEQAWRIGRSGDRKAIREFCAQGQLHRDLMSGRIKFNGRPHEFKDDQRMEL